MSCRIWAESPPEHSSEREYILKLVKRLTDTPEDYWLFINFFIPEQIDLLIFKRECIFLIELKEWKGKITAKLNGNWQINGVDIERENPYRQITKQYNSLKDYLEKRKSDFCPPQKAHLLNFKNIVSIICICPHLDLDPHSEKKPPIKLIGFDNIYEELFKTVGTYDFIEKEIENLANLLGLKELKDIKDIEDFFNEKEKLPKIDWDLYINNILKDKSYVELKEKYIQLQLLKKSQKKYERENGNILAKSSNFNIIEIVDIENEINKNNTIYIFGEPGSGKTALLQNIVYDYAKKRKEKKAEDARIPIFVPLILYDSKLGGIYGLIKDILNKYGVDITIEDLKDEIRRNRELIILFDGVDEIPDKELGEARKDLIRFRYNNNETKIVVSARKGYEVGITEEATRLYINKLEKGQKIELLMKFFQKRSGHSKVNIENNSMIENVLDLIEVPLEAEIFAEIVDNLEFINILSAGDILDEFVQYRLKKEADKGKVSGEVYEYDILPFLQHIAFEMKKKKLRYMKKSELYQWCEEIGDELYRNGKIKASLTEIKKALGECPFFIYEKNKIFFKHDRFLDYFASRKLSDIFRLKGEIPEEIMSNVDWNEATALCFELLGNRADDLIDYAMELYENYHLISICLTEKYGFNVAEKAKKIIENLITSTNKDNKIIAIRILGECTPSPYALMRLLYMLTEEERFLEKKYKEMGYDQWDPSWESNINIKSTIFSSENLSDDEKDLILKTDFRLFKEIEGKLIKFMLSKNPNYLKVKKYINDFSITARGYLTQIIGRIWLKETEDEVLNFLKERLNPSVEPSIEVRTSAYRCIDDWLYKYPENQKIIAFLEEWLKDPTASEDFSGFPDNIDECYREKQDILTRMPKNCRDITHIISKKENVDAGEIRLYFKALKMCINLIKDSKYYENNEDRKIFLIKLRKEFGLNGEL